MGVERSKRGGWLLVSAARATDAAEGVCPRPFSDDTKKQEEVEGVQRSDFSANLPPWQKRQIHGRKAQVNECIIVEHRASK